MHEDAKLIDKYGGATRLAELLGYLKAGGAQRVQNWRMRGIPAAVKLERPDLFLRELRALDHESATRSDDDAPTNPAHALTLEKPAA